MEEQEIDLRDLVNVVLKRWKLILVPGLIAALVAFVVVRALPPVYESYSLLKIGFYGKRTLEAIPAIKEVMQSYPMRGRIAEKLNHSGNESMIGSLNSILSYDDKSEMLKIQAKARTPEEAERYAKAATDVVLERHQAIYDNAKEKTDKMVIYIRDSIRPVPLLSSDVSEFRVEMTEVVLPPSINKEPVATRTKSAPIVIFFLTAIIAMLVAFYVEGNSTDRPQ